MKTVKSKNCLQLFSAYASFSLYSEEICRRESSLMINFWQLWQIIYALEKNLIPCLLFGEIQNAIKWIPLICYLHTVIWTKYLWIELFGEKKILNPFHKTLSWTFSGELMLSFFHKQNQNNSICDWQNKTQSFRIRLN